MVEKFTDLDWALVSAYADSLDGTTGGTKIWGSVKTQQELHAPDVDGLLSVCGAFPYYMTPDRMNQSIYHLTEAGYAEVRNRELDVWLSLVREKL